MIRAECSARLSVRPKSPEFRLGLPFGESYIGARRLGGQEGSTPAVSRNYILRILAPSSQVICADQGKSIDIPNLLELQRASFDKFLQSGVGNGEAGEGGAAERFCRRIPDSRFQQYGIPGVRWVHPRKSRNTTFRNVSSGE